MVIVRKRKKNRSRGAAAVEAALVLPILLLVTFGAIRYGWFFLKAQQITNAARCGARVAIVAAPTIEGNQEVLDVISNLLGPNKAKIIGENEAPPVTFEVNGASVGDITTAGYTDLITVIITVKAADVDILPMGLFKFEPDDWKLGASVTMAKEGVNTEE